MEIAFETKSLRDICERGTQAKAEFDVAVAESLQRRLADMRAAPTVVELPAGRPNEATESGIQVMALDLSEGFRLIFGANHPNQPTTANGDVDWAKVSRVKILRIGNNDRE